MSEKKFKWVVVLAMAPVVLWPLLLTSVDTLDTALERFLVLAMPVFTIACGYLAHYTYRDRPEVAWILLAVLLLTQAAAWVL
ncbi:MAG: hypothetical protein Q4B68_11245 [Bacteroidales bacterium]|nr:hypothetical protein [Bacteroidales bacterium]